MGGIAFAGSGIVSAQQGNGHYRNPRVTAPLIQQWEVEARETNRTPFRPQGVDLGDAFTTTLLYKDTRLTETLAERLRREFNGIVGALIVTRVTFESPLSTFAQPALVAEFAKQEFERTARRHGFSELHERHSAERETTREQATAEYDGYYSIGRYTDTPTPEAARFPGIQRGNRVKTVLYFDVSRSEQSLLIATGIRPTDELLQAVLNRDSDAYRQELLQLMHSVR
ncbi:hypothetical protein GCM10009000_071530 [Halobacterium noricense]|uniref:Uncharacterized protein n=1 Tax=Haladaptatus pallidirubidus TaxID=1008152 RepID=A0AAV3UL26_9EURY